MENSMKQLSRPIAFACLVAAACLLAPAVLAQTNPRIGVWALDLDKSTYQQGEAPARETRTYLATDDGGIQMTGDTVLASGTKQPTGYRAKYDGKDYPYSGAAGNSIAVSGDGWTADSTIKMVGKITQTTHSTVSKDGKTMTMTTKTASGRAVSTRIYRKQP
jgi:hypothetical protein